MSCPVYCPFLSGAGIWSVGDPKPPHPARNIDDTAEAAAPVKARLVRVEVAGCGSKRAPSSFMSNELAHVRLLKGRFERLRVRLTRVGGSADDVDIRALRLQCLRAQQWSGDLAGVRGVRTVSRQLGGLDVRYVPVRDHHAHDHVTKEVRRVGSGEGAVHRN